MFDIIITVVLMLVPLLMVGVTVRTWQESKNLWAILPVPFFLVAALAFVFNWADGLYMLLLAFAVRLGVGLFIKKR